MDRVRPLVLAVSTWSGGEWDKGDLDSRWAKASPEAKKAEHFHFDFKPHLGDGQRVVDELRQWHVVGGEARGEQLAKAIGRFVKEALLVFRKPTMTQAGWGTMGHLGPGLGGRSSRTWCTRKHRDWSQRWSSRASSGLHLSQQERAGVSLGVWTRRHAGDLECFQVRPVNKLG